MMGRSFASLLSDALNRFILMITRWVGKWLTIARYDMVIGNSL